jgi:hypothetical protein
MEKVLVERFSFPPSLSSYSRTKVLSLLPSPGTCDSLLLPGDEEGYYIIKLFRNLIISLHSKVYAQTRKITQAEAVQYQYRSGSSSFGLYMMVVRNCNSLLAYFVVRRGKTW